MQKKPHIIIFNPDQFRADALHHLGNEASVTPNFDKICQTDGVSFRNAFCQNPVCTPSRCSFMSGWYPHVAGHRTMFNMMKPNEPVLLKELKDDGYFVWWGGKNDLVPSQNGFENYCDIKYKPSSKLRPDLHSADNWRGDESGDNFYSFYAGKLDTNGENLYFNHDCGNVMGAVNFIENAPQDKPICIYLPLNYPHPPYGVEDPWFSMICRDKIPKRAEAIDKLDEKPTILRGIYESQNMKNWSEERFTELRATYLGMCGKVDYLFGLIVSALKKAGMYDNSAIFVLSDHGDFTGDYGLVEKTQNTFEDCLTNVPLIIKPPADFPVKNGINESLVELIDFTATVREFAEIKSKHDEFGRSLTHLLKGDTFHRDAVFCEGGRLQGETQCMELESAINQGKPSLYAPRLLLQRKEGAEHTKAVMLRTERYKYVYRLYESDEFYDLENDKYEQNNRINDASLSDIINELRLRMIKFFVETCDVVPRETDKR